MSKEALSDIHNRRITAIKGMRWIFTHGKEWASVLEYLQVERDAASKTLENSALYKELKAAQSLIRMIDKMSKLDTEIRNLVGAPSEE